MLGETQRYPLCYRSICVYPFWNVNLTVILPCLPCNWEHDCAMNWEFYRRVFMLCSQQKVITAKMVSVGIAEGVYASKCVGFAKHKCSQLICLSSWECRTAPTVLVRTAHTASRTILWLTFHLNDLVYVRAYHPTISQKWKLLAALLEFN